MNQRSYNLVTGLLFTVFALVHAIRFAGNWPFIIGGWEISRWVSAIAILAAAYLALAAFRLRRSAQS
jgi:hypothetical protein